MIIPGTVKRGHRIASGMTSDSPYPCGSLHLQFPFFRSVGLDLYSFYKATINIDISPQQWRPVQTDYTFERITWTDTIDPETFSFLKCRVLYEKRETIAWIYYPHPETKPDHFQSPSIVEVITSKLNGLEYGDHISLLIDSNKIHLY